MTDSRLETERLLGAVAAAVENGAEWVQVRDPAASGRALYDLTGAVAAVCRPRGARVVVNDRIDVALAVGAVGVQLGRRSLPVEAVRRIAPGLRVGVSVHSLDEARAAQAAGADWLTFGHVFSTASHPGEKPRGLAALAEICGATRIPVIAIGGIDADRVGEVLAAGAAGIAVISAILDANDPGKAARALVCGLKASAPY
ncbi:MAG TPA: thiamine phosphate synthase [Chloroflexota bacterium]|nr:thiamine phosphate synthase [Chloroflexota bacterium]